MVLNPTTSFTLHPAELIAALVAQQLNGFVEDFRRLFAVAASAYHQTDETIREEFELIKKAQHDPRFFAPIYEKYYDPIFIYISKRIDNDDITAELTARVFFNSLKNLKKYKFLGVPFSAWLYKVALNEINQFFRQQRVFERSVSLNDTHIDLLIEELDRKEPMIDKYVLVSVLLEQLTPNDLQFIELRFFENRSFKEMGFLLGMTEVNAKVKTYRVLNKLKKLSKEINYHE